MTTPETTKKFLVFLSHANEDKPAVRKLAKRLKKDGFDPWLDEERLLPGQNWELEIERAFKASGAILLCCSVQSISKEGFIQKEYKRAMYYQERKPEGEIFVIPVRLDNCELPYFLHELQWADFPVKYDQLTKALNARARKLSPSISSNKDSEFGDPDSKKDTSTVQLIINRDFSEFNKDQEAELVSFLTGLLNIEKNNIRILKVSEGSVIVDMEIPRQEAKKLVHLARKGDSRLVNSQIVFVALGIKNKNELKTNFLQYQHIRVYLDNVNAEIDRAHSSLDQLKILLSVGWPPTRVSYTDFENKMSSLDSEWNESQSIIIMPDKEIENLQIFKRRYQRLADDILEGISQVKSDQMLVARDENKISLYCDAYKKFASELSTPFDVAQEIRKLISDADIALNTIKSNFQSGKITHEAAIVAIEKIADNISGSTIQVANSKLQVVSTGDVGVVVVSIS